MHVDLSIGNASSSSADNEYPISCQCLDNEDNLEVLYTLYGVCETSTIMVIQHRTMDNDKAMYIHWAVNCFDLPM